MWPSVERRSVSGTTSNASVPCAAAVTGDSFDVALVPHTLAVTTLGGLARGDGVNLEVDVLAKYVEKLIGPDTI